SFAVGPLWRTTMATKNTKHDPLEAAKITGDRAAADAAALGATMPVNPAQPSPAVIAATTQQQPAPSTDGPVYAPGHVPPGQFVPPAEPPAPALSQDGPTIEEYIAAGYPADKYPPDGYAEKPSPGLTRHKAGGVIDPEWIEAARVAARARDDAEDARRRG